MNENFVNKWTDLSALFEKDNGEQILDKNIVNEVESFLNKITQLETERDVAEQQSLFTKWSQQQEKDLKEQIKNFRIDAKKESLLKQLDDLERQEEILTFFDKKEIIQNAYNSGGFSDEHPSEIPIEPDQEQFDAKFERHFKPWQKYANRPAHTLRISEEKQDALESLRKIYFNNRKAQTSNQAKLVTKK